MRPLRGGCGFTWRDMGPRESNLGSHRDGASVTLIGCPMGRKGGSWGAGYTGGLYLRGPVPEAAPDRMEHPRGRLCGGCHTWPADAGFPPPTADLTPCLPSLHDPENP